MRETETIEIWNYFNSLKNEEDKAGETGNYDEEEIILQEENKKHNFWK